MLISEAKKHIGQIVEVNYVDRIGNPRIDLAEVFDVNFIALFGPCLITDLGDIRLDRVRSVRLAPSAKTA